MTLIGEDLLLLLLDDAKGTLAATSTLRPALGGAVLVELALAEAVTIDKQGGLWRRSVVRADPGAVPTDPVLAAGLATVAEKPRSAQDLVNRLGKGLQEQLLDRLVERGILRREEDRVLGLFPRTRWPAADSSHEEEVRRALAATLLQGLEPDPRTGSLVALLHAIGRAHKTVDHRGVPAGQVRKRAQQIAEGDWAAKAVKDAVAAAGAAVAAGVAAAATGAAVS